MKYCKRCKKELDGEMIFYPDICLICTIELDRTDKKELAKYEKTERKIQS